MKSSSERILTTHGGSLVRPVDLMGIMRVKQCDQPDSEREFATCVRDCVRDVVRKQIETGIDVISDGEYGKPSFTRYVNERLTGFTREQQDERNGSYLYWGRVRTEFRDFYEEYDALRPVSSSFVACTGPIKYCGHSAVQEDIETFKIALAGMYPEEPFMTAVAPGTVELQRRNFYYPSEEAYLFAIAEAMREEYRAIVDAGFLLQIDDPRVATQYGIPESAPDIDEYRKFSALRVEALNHALVGIPVDRVRYHVCWGSSHGPHVHDVPLKDIVDVILRARVGAYCLESANPRHEHEWQVWEHVKLPAGKILIPGVISHTTNIVEHPELVAWRIATYARLLGRENLIAGTDCGFSQGAFTPRVHPSIMWAKLRALTEGAALASKQLCSWAVKKTVAKSADVAEEMIARVAHSSALHSRRRSNNAFAVWFTGLSSAGKTTLSRIVHERLVVQGFPAELIDSDEMRQTLCRDLGFTKADRDENVRRLGFVAELLTRNGIIVLVSAISPHRAIRDEVRHRIGNFIEVYVNAPLEICEQRDTHRVYGRARSGEISHVAGIDDVYEAPTSPEVECRTDYEAIEESVDKILIAMEARLTVSRKEYEMCAQRNGLVH